MRAVGQKVRVPRTGATIVDWLRIRERLRRAARRGDDEQRTANGRLKHNPIVGAPSGAARHLRVGERLRGAAVDRHAFQFAAAKHEQRAAIG